MSKAQQEAIRKELVDRATGKGKEPNWGEGEPTQLQLITALNFYSATVEADQLQKYAIAWAKKNCPDKVVLIGAQPDWKFQTYGALMRMDSRGLKLSKKHIDSIHKFVNELEMPEKKETNSTKPKRKKIMTNVENANYRSFCDSLDKAVEAKEFQTPEIEVDKNFPVAPVIEVCERELASMKDDPTIYPEHMNKWFRAVMKIMNGGKVPEAANAPVKPLKRAAKPAATKDTASPKSKPKPKKAEPKKAEPNVGNPTAGNHALDGKTQAFLFDTRYGRLTRLVSTKGGFSVKGKTISGIDEKKSKVALLKNFDGAKYLAGVGTEVPLNDWMTKCVKKGAPIQVSSRLADAVLVLEAA